MFARQSRFSDQLHNPPFSIFVSLTYYLFTDASEVYLTNCNINTSLVGSWCLLLGNNPKDVCNLSATKAQAQAHAVAAGLLGHTELRLQVLPHLWGLLPEDSLQGLELQRALTGTDYETLRALDADNVPTTPSMTERINTLPVHKYQGCWPESAGSSSTAERLLQHQSVPSLFS
ncbi:hypothetical protein HAX54_039231 [Datura stramonium]|uniref:Uncharacterized protein n=1 Tax=Datura stramonium TaxID=4076 RepID=A0ABS8VMF3_DATST|nr:hypothetical protein [Datura stramonium]